MAKYRKKPVVIEATRWFKNGDHPDDHVGEKTADVLTGEEYIRQEGAVVRYFRHPEIPGDQPCSKCGLSMRDHGWIDTLEDGYNVCPGDWIITGVAGERYPCKDHIFRQTYEAVGE